MQTEKQDEKPLDLNALAELPSPYWARKFREATLHRLGRYVNKLRRLEREGNRALRDLSPGSRFRKPVEAQLSMLQGTKNLLKLELEKRHAISH